mmetsp:Transcript_18273/g.38376  ORF Transcript_18273/g.38376 Transcript_18273/m.38376 type:complete len:950 (+) Transcript_18273:92-2941(+)
MVVSLPSIVPNVDPLVSAALALLCVLLRFSSDLISEFSEAAQKSADADEANNHDDGDAIVDGSGITVVAARNPPLLSRIWGVINSCLQYATAERASPEEEEEEEEGSMSLSLLPPKPPASGHDYGSMKALQTSTGDSEMDVENQDGINGCDNGNDNDNDILKQPKSALEASTPPISLAFHILLFAYFSYAAILLGTQHSPPNANSIYRAGPLSCASAAAFLGIVWNVRDFHRKRFRPFQRVMYSSSAVLFLFGCMVALLGSIIGSAQSYDSNNHPLTTVDAATLLMLLLWTILAIAECRLYQYPQFTNTNGQKKAKLSTTALMTMLKPYFWPHATSTSATINRIRAVATWLCVLLSKACSISAPIFIGRASTALTRLDYTTAIWFSLYYAMARLGSSVFKECQGLLYLFVAQAAFVELSEVTFEHLHNLSLDWHLRKKLGETIRSMDRGIGACDSLMRTLFLLLLPAIGETVVVIFIFASYFDYFPLAVTVFAFVYVYALLTILMTLWRKKFRNRVVKSDNDWHDICTDSLINFEVVKYFTAESFETKRFVKSIERYQLGSVNVKASLSTLNISQQVLVQACLAVCLSLAVVSIRNRIDCCLSFGCDRGNSECCSASQVCSGLEIGDFVAVLTYTLNLFQPLNYLGSIYNSIIMSLVDLTNLSELLVENPDVVDADDAVEVPLSNGDGTDVVVKFDNVRFHYPTQPETKGLRGLTFELRKGTTTAIVGPTGQGKTTVSRLLFRFYDVLGGSVKINGVDSRLLKQKSLRGAIGVVPQNNSLFNDTLKNNIKYGRQDATDAEIMQVIEDAQLKSFIDSLPEGWNAMVGDRGLKLSGGEQQRTSIARCLLKNPPIVVLDEATSALDTVTENSIQESLDRLGNDRTVLVIAHRLGTIKGADNIIVLGDGKVAEEGTHDELLALGGKYAEMWNMQLNSTGGNRSTGSLTGLMTG